MKHKEVEISKLVGDHYKGIKSKGQIKLQALELQPMVENYKYIEIRICCTKGENRYRPKEIV